MSMTALAFVAVPARCAPAGLGVVLELFAPVAGEDAALFGAVDVTAALLAVGVCMIDTEAGKV